MCTGCEVEGSAQAVHCSGTHDGSSLWTADLALPEEYEQPGLFYRSDGRSRWCSERWLRAEAGVAVGTGTRSACCSSYRPSASCFCQIRARILCTQRMRHMWGRCSNRRSSAVVLTSAASLAIGPSRADVMNAESVGRTHVGYRPRLWAWSRDERARARLSRAFGLEELVEGLSQKKHMLHQPPRDPSLSTHI